MLDLREHKRVHDTLSDVLPWAALVAPDVVLNKDGSFLSVIRRARKINPFFISS